jgi:predicted nucleic acid-binding protein
MKSDYKIFLDACVLANISVCDLLLRLAEKPRLYVPAWSEKVLNEVFRVHTERLKWPKALAESFQHEIRAAFPEAMTNGFEYLETQITNNPKDRHVLAAAIHGGASHIVTFNLKDFPRDSTESWSILVEHPQQYLLTLYDIDSAQVVSRIAAIAARRDTDPETELLRLGRVLPRFSSRLLDDLQLG